MDAITGQQRISLCQMRYRIVLNCHRSHINGWSRLVAGVAVYVSVIDAESRINTRCGGEAHVTREDPQMVIHRSWCGKMSKRKASYLKFSSVLFIFIDMTLHARSVS